MRRYETVFILNPDLSDEQHKPLYDKLTGRNAEITYEADNVEVWVPSGVGEDATHALWKVNGNLKIRARDGAEA